MNIQEKPEEFKRPAVISEFITALVLVVVAVLSYGLGRMSKVENVSSLQQSASASESSAIVENGASTAVTEELSDEPALVPGGYVGSKNGTKYHLPWCPGAQRIKEANKVWFGTKEEAEVVGYTPAANCKGI